jgi:hypothetical protein
MITRGELGSTGGPVVSTPELVSAMAIPPGERRALAIALHVDKDLQLGVATLPLDGRPGASFTPLGPVDPKEVHPPFAFGDLAVQP